jgi:DNA polymerase IV (DinB-like DNA polymerase)
MPIILHVDLDAFYAAVEEREHPEYKGRPIAVGADPKGGTGRGVVATSNYAARRFGIKSAMPVSIAYRKCPDCVFLPVNMDLYVRVSQKIMQILSAYAEKMEQVSVDEAYLDVSSAKTYEKAREIAQKIKDEIQQKEKLTCSVGIGPNKLIAKVASDFKKPDGLFIVKPAEVLDFLAPQPVRILRGVGPKTEEALGKLGIKTVADVRKFSREQLVEVAGSFGIDLYEQSRGNYSAELITDWTPKSMGRNYTFERDTNDKNGIYRVLDEMCTDVWKQLTHEKMTFKTVTVRVRYEDFDTHTKQKSLIDYVDNIEAIRNTAKELLVPFLKDKRKIRLVGMSLGKLKQEK